MLIDTHAHLDFPDFQNEVDGILTRANERQVTSVITIGINLDSCKKSLELAEAHSHVHVALGIHPCDVATAPSDWLEQLTNMLKHKKVVAIGECGFDFHHYQTSIKGMSHQEIDQLKVEQETFFRAQLELAVQLGLNVIIHQRESWGDTLGVLADYTHRLRAVFHCFGGTPEQARQVIDMGHMVSFTGIVTFKNAKALHATASTIPLDSFMLETDCPFLAPTPYRGQRCEPMHTRFIAEAVAKLRNTTWEEIAHATTQNAHNFFRFPKP
jgi:TatD DNase family protein